MKGFVGVGIFGDFGWEFGAHFVEGQKCNFAGEREIGKRRELWIANNHG